MDNAGGHGTKDAIEEYVNDLKQVHNVVIIWQVPRSPETNLLDLGVWNSIQSAVDKAHCGTKSNVTALTRTVVKTWASYSGTEVFERAFQRWRKVLSLILAGNGDNHLVEKGRGKLLVPLPHVLGPPKDAEENGVDNANGTKGAVL